MPRQLGPTSRMPNSRAMPNISACRACPSAPASAKPANEVLVLSQALLAAQGEESVRRRPPFAVALGEPAHDCPERSFVVGLQDLAENFGGDWPIQQWLDEDHDLHEETLQQRILDNRVKIYEEKKSGRSKKGRKAS